MRYRRIGHLCNGHEPLLLDDVTSNLLKLGHGILADHGFFHKMIELSGQHGLDEMYAIGYNDSEPVRR